MTKHLSKCASYLLVLLLWCAPTVADDDALAVLGKALEPLHRITSGAQTTFTIEMTVTAPLGPEGKTAYITLSRRGDDEMAVYTRGTPLGTLRLVRTKLLTTIIQCETQRPFVGRGPLPDGNDALRPGEFARRLARASGDLGTLGDMFQTARDGRAMAVQLAGMLRLVEAKGDAAGKLILKSSEPVSDRVFTLAVAKDGPKLESLTWTSPKGGGELGLAIKFEAEIPAPADAPEWTLVDRVELERTLMRGLPRAIEIGYRRDRPKRLRDRTRRRDGGVLSVRQGQRVCFLTGGPREIGTQHGKLLKKEVRANVDAVLYTFCLAESMKSGRWMLNEFRKARDAVRPHVPREYKDELAALAEASGVSLDELELANAMPVLRHCSGFALKGTATAGGKLVHGRVLDYMMSLGLQDNAALFVVRKTAAKPFVHAGYAGFVGCISGMNAERITAGHMGGGGAGQWDGVPAALLMRMVMERAASLAEALAVLKDNKRTCRYAYVISDGGAGDARAVEASGDSIKVVAFGEMTTGQPEAVADAVIISSGERMKALVAAIKATGGKIDETVAKGLMAAPVAAKGANLHNVLFVPQDLVLFVAGARGRKDAFEEVYYRYDLGKLLAEPGAARGQITP
jgi:Acyl-coenzyme A:6-aminopenicillanic acid acyl-transferase